MRHVLALVLVFCAGCAAYLTPGGPAPLADIGHGDAILSPAQQPSLQFPANLGLVRVQAAAYRSFSSTGIGSGRFSVVATQELHGDRSLQSVAKWPQVAEAQAIDPVLLPARLESLDDLRLAAAKHQADVLMAYTIDTVFQVKGHRYGPLADLPLGKAPGEASIDATASAAFFDVRTGFRYGETKASIRLADLGDAWQSGRLLDGKRMQAEREAFAALLSEAEKTWSGIAGRYEYAQQPGPSLTAAR